MAIVRAVLRGGKLYNLDTGELMPIPKGREMTDDEIHEAALSDPDNPPLTAEDFKRMKWKR